jgi:hypothetical protein
VLSGKCKRVREVVSKMINTNQVITFLTGFLVFVLENVAVVAAKATNY